MANKATASKRNKLLFDLLISIGTGAFITIFLYAFQPFGMHGNNSAEMLRICINYGLITTSCLLLNTAAALLLPDLFDQDSWRLPHRLTNAAVILFTIGLGNFLYAASIFNSVSLNWQDMFSFQLYTLGIGLIPVVVLNLYSSNRSLQKRLREAEQLNTKIAVREEEPVQEELLLTIHSDNEGEELQLAANNILLLRAQGNYVQVFYQTTEGNKQQMLRTTLSRAATDVAAYPALFRCHRSHLVNLQHVQHVSGNALGFQLQVDGLKEEVNVSRSYIDAFKEAFSKLKS